MTVSEKFLRFRDHLLRPPRLSQAEMDSIDMSLLRVLEGDELILAVELMEELLLTKKVGDARLAKALTWLELPEARDALVRLLDTHKPRNFAGIEIARGAWKRAGDVRAVHRLISCAASRDRDLRTAALVALAEVRGKSVDEVFAEAHATATDPAVEAQALSLLLGRWGLTYTKARRSEAMVKALEGLKTPDLADRREALARCREVASTLKKEQKRS